MSTHLLEPPVGPPVVNAGDVRAERGGTVDALAGHDIAEHDVIDDGGHGRVDVEAEPAGPVPLDEGQDIAARRRGPRPTTSSSSLEGQRLQRLQETRPIDAGHRP